MTEIITKTFGDWLKEKRTARSLSQTDLATLSGLTKGYISNLERNIRQPISNELVKPSVETVDKLAKALDVSVKEARFTAGYATPEEIETIEDVDYELAYLFHASRDWSEENRQEAYENAKAIFRRYQEKERLNYKLSEKNVSTTVEANKDLDEVERGLQDYREKKKSGEPPKGKIKMNPPDADSVKNIPHLKFENGKILNELGEEIKKPSENQKAKDK